MKEFKAMRFKVSGPEESEALQRYLFSLGYKWVFGGAKIKHTEMPYLFTSREGLLSHGASSTSFEDKEYQEMKLVTKTTVVVEKILPVRDNPFLYNDGSVVIEQGTPIEVIYRNGEKNKGRFGGECSHRYLKLWSMAHEDYSSDIVAYRILMEEEL